MADPLDDLYGAPLDEFVAHRDALAKELRGQGRRDEAEAAKKLRKPTVAAWAVNAAARREPRRVERLLDAGGRLRAAHAELLEGGPAAAVQEAAAAEREAVEGLVDAARDALEEASRPATDATLDRVRDTLHAAASDERVRELLREGRVVADEEATGFAFAGLTPGKPAARRPARAPKPSAAEKRAEERRRVAEECAAQARRELEEAEGTVRDAERALARAEQEADRRRTALERAERALEHR